jgi:hypothetical protein
MIKHQCIIVLAITLFAVQEADCIQRPVFRGRGIGEGWICDRVSSNDIQIDGYSYRFKVGAELDRRVNRSWKVKGFRFQ